MAQFKEDLVNTPSPHLRLFYYGQCKILVGKENGKWHLSISHPKRNPTWEEIKEARYVLMPEDIVVAQLLPPKSQYVNIHQYCFHLWEI